MKSHALIVSIIVGTILQVGMVVGGHYSERVSALFAVGGMGFSLVAGLVYVRLAGSGTWGSFAAGGAIAGGVCAFIGILISRLLGDVPTTLLALGTLSSVVTGGIGGWIGRFFAT